MKQLIRKLRMMGSIARSRITGYRPMVLSHLVTSRCDCQCHFCLWRSGEAMQDELTTGEVFRLYGQAARAGFLSVVLWGGEPLLRDDVAEVLAHAKSLGLRTGLITNGSLLAARAGEIIPHLDELLVSLDAASEVHDVLRGHPGLFQKVLAGLERIKNSPTRPRCSIISVVSKHNIAQIGPLLVFSKTQGIPIVFQAMNISDYGTPARGLDLAADLPGREAETTAFHAIAAAKSAGYPVLNSFRYLAAIERHNEEFRCEYKRAVLRVEPDGRVLDCTVGNVSLADLRAEPLDSLLRSPRFRQFLQACNLCDKCRDAGVRESTYLWQWRVEPWLNAGRISRLFRWRE